MQKQYLNLTEIFLVAIVLYGCSSPLVEEIEKDVINDIIKEVAPSVDMKPELEKDIG